MREVKWGSKERTPTLQLEPGGREEGRRDAAGMGWATSSIHHHHYPSFAGWPCPGFLYSLFAQDQIIHRRTSDGCLHDTTAIPDRIKGGCRQRALYSNSDLGERSVDALLSLDWFVVREERRGESLFLLGSHGDDSVRVQHEPHDAAGVEAASQRWAELRIASAPDHIPHRTTVRVVSVRQ